MPQQKKPSKQMTKKRTLGKGDRFLFWEIGARPVDPVPLPEKVRSLKSPPEETDPGKTGETDPRKTEEMKAPGDTIRSPPERGAVAPTGREAIVRIPDDIRGERVEGEMNPGEAETPNASLAGKRRNGLKPRASFQWALEFV